MFSDSKTMVTLVKVLLNWPLDGINHGNPILFLSCCDLWRLVCSRLCERLLSSPIMTFLLLCKQGVWGIRLQLTQSWCYVSAFFCLQTKKIKRKMKGDSCTDENPHWFPPFSLEIGQIQHRALSLQNRRDLPPIWGEWNWPISCLNESKKLPGGVRLQRPPPPLEDCTFGACLRNRSALILRLLQHIRPHILEGFSSHNPWNMCIWGSCGREVLHFVTQSNNVVLNKQGFW